MQNKYKIGITSYDDFNLLWETKVGLDDKKRTLLYSVWGKTEVGSQKSAEQLVRFLEKVEHNFGLH